MRKDYLLSAFDGVTFQKGKEITVLLHLRVTYAIDLRNTCLKVNIKKNTNTALLTRLPNLYHRCYELFDGRFHTLKSFEE